MKKIILLLIFNLMFAFFWIADAQNFEWVNHIGSDVGDVGKSVITDESGNIYISGQFTGIEDMDPSLNEKYLTTNGEFDLFIEKLNSSGDLVWLRQLGGTGLDRLISNEMDQHGNLYIAGSFEGSVNFDPGLGINNLDEDNGEIFILKLDSEGSFLWVKQLHAGVGRGLTHYYNLGFEVDLNGNIFISGIGGGMELNEEDEEVVFVLKLDANGEIEWEKHYGGDVLNKGFKISSSSLALDDVGNIYIAGWFNSTRDFNPGLQINNLTSVDNTYDIYLLKLDGLGNFVWVKHFIGDGSNYSYEVKIDAFGDILLSGDFDGKIDLDPNEGNFFLDGGGINNNELFLTKLDKSGSFKWAKKLDVLNSNISEGESFVALEVDSKGYIYLGGTYSAWTDFNTGLDELTLESPYFNGFFISKIDTSGSFIWAQEFGYDGLSFGLNNLNSIAIDISENIYATGSFRNTTDFDPGPTTFNLEDGGIYIYKINQSSTAIFDNFFDSSLTFYPNPIKDKINIKLGKVYPELNVSVRNILGQEVISQKYNGVDRFQLSLDVATSGIYFIHLWEKAEKRAVLKVLKQ